MQSIKELLNQLDWTVYRFGKESGISETTAYRIANQDIETSSSKLAVKWLEAEINLRSNR